MMIKIHIIHCGDVRVDMGVPFADISKNPIAYTGLFRNKKNRIILPVKSFLIEHPKGKILVDTGWHTEVRINPIKHETFPLWFTGRPYLPKGMAINEQLEKLNVSIQDIDYVMLTHLDIDHASGLQLVKSAKHIMASPTELEDKNLKNIRYNKKSWDDIHIKPVPFIESGIGPDEKSFDVFDDGTVQVISSCGHSKGSLIIKVENNGKFILIVGDTGYNETSWKELRVSGPIYNKNKMLNALKWVKNMSQSKNCIGIFACHDAKVSQQTVNI